MRLFLVVEETRFYMPDFIAGFLRQTTDEVVGAALVTRVSPRNSLRTYLHQHWYYLRPEEIVKLMAMQTAMAVRDQFNHRTAEGPFYSVRSVLEWFDIGFFEVEVNINRAEYLDRIRALQPDVIISSNPLIFRDEILKLPRLCCLNRHSALLPANGGLWPVFQAMRKGESHAGVTVHTMEREIDKGIFLMQKAVPIEPHHTVGTLYAETYRLSVEALAEALDKVRRNDLTPQVLFETETSYYSFPTRQHWREFRARGCRFI